MRLPHILDSRAFLISVVLSLSFLVALLSALLTMRRPNVKAAADWNLRIVNSTRWRDDVHQLYALGCGFAFAPESATCHNPDDTLAAISRIESLRYVQFFGENIGDSASLLANLPRLERLCFRQCQIPHGALRFLGDVDSLRYLTVASSGLCDEDLHEILGAARLVSLNLSYNPDITEQGLEPYQHAAMLTEIDLNNTGVRHLAFVRRMSGLVQLHLSQTQIRDSDLGDLVGLQRLEELDVSATLISDDGIRHVASIKTLRRVNMCHTKATPNVIRWLQQALPTAVIHHDESNAVHLSEVKTDPPPEDGPQR